MTSKDFYRWYVTSKDFYRCSRKHSRETPFTAPCCHYYFFFGSLVRRTQLKITMGFWQDWVTDDLPSNYIGPTTWLFLLSPRWSLVMLIGLTTVAFQVCILVAFVQGTDEQLFFPSCGKWDGSYDPVTLDPIAPELFCERDIADIWVVIAAGFIALAWTLPDIFQGFQFWISSCHFPHSWPQRIQLLIAGIFSMEIGGYRFFAANSWLYRDAPNNAQAILGVVCFFYSIQNGDHSSSLYLHRG